ncbi:MAG TPA: molybdate ABC transporter substrate-binding protein [Thermoanaerobaculia bacterium]|nr:molybdate ABC transporter substrate-binding protein [Thermoanaerobaculia bacterium]
MRKLLLCLLIALPLRGDEVTVFAAASLTDVLQEIAHNYERTSSDKIVFNFAASSTLARQIELGAPADLFTSADEAKMDALQKNKLIDAKTRVSLLSNTLVIVSNVPVKRPHDLVNVQSIALAEPSSVPAGIYAKQYLTKIGIWDRVASKVIPTDNVRSALAAVKAGNADAAIVYKTDAKTFACEIKDGPPISYPFAIVRDAQHAAAARRFLQYLASKAARNVFLKHGFLVK